MDTVLFQLFLSAQEVFCLYRERNSVYGAAPVLRISLFCLVAIISSGKSCSPDHTEQNVADQINLSSSESSTCKFHLNTPQFRA